MIFTKKEKFDCYHEYISTIRYYTHELTRYINMSDRIELYAVHVCEKCLDTKEIKIDERYFPVNNNDSKGLKEDYLSFLRNNEVVSKEEYLFKVY